MCDSERAANPERLFFIDNLRIVLTVLVVVHHQAVFYATNVPLILFLMFNQAYFMGLFFFLSGLFTPSSYDRKGPWGFLKDRLMRLGIPILIYVFMLSPIAKICMSIFQQTNDTGHILSSLSWSKYFDMIGIGQLWFLVMLLIFDACYILWRVATANKQWKIPGKNSTPKIRAICLFIAALAFITYLTRIIVPINTWVLFFPSLAYLPQYISFFIIGTVAYQRDWLRLLPDRLGKTALIATIVGTFTLFIVAMNQVIGTGGGFIGNGHWQSGVYALWDSLFAVGLCLFLLIFFRRRLNNQKNFGRSLQKSCFAVFIIHSIVIVIAATVLRDLQLMPLLKFFLAGCISVPLSFATAYLLRKIPYANRIL